MRLRWQLLVVSLLTLALPWAGAQYTVALERAQRADREMILRENAALVERILSARLERLPDPLLEHTNRAPARELAARQLDGAALLDGFADDWRPPGRGAQITRVTAADGTTATWQAGLDERFLHLQLTVETTDPRLRRAPVAGEAPPHDVLLLAYDAPNGARTWARIDTSAPGPVTARQLRDDAPLPRIRGYWQTTARGHAVELRLPLELVGDRLGFAFLRCDDDQEGEWFGTLVGGSRSAEVPVQDPTIRQWRSVAPGLLIRPAPRVAALLEQLRRPNQRISVVDSAGWRLATVGALYGEVQEEETDTGSGGMSLAASLLRLLLRQEDASMPTLDAETQRPRMPQLDRALSGESAALRYRTLAPPTDATSRDAAGASPAGAADRPGTPSVVLSAAQPIRGLTRNDVLGAVMIEQSTENYLSLATPAFARLMQATLLASLVAALGLVAYATLLSVRIARLRNAAEAAAERVLRPGGAATYRIGAMPLTRDGDELGDLARSFAVLLERLRQQADYLQSLAQKLSHELRTPLSVVQSSLENLSADQSVSAGPYVTRASAGAERLGAILKAMSEASRLEQSLAAAEMERFDLAALLAGVREGYAVAWPSATFTVELQAPGACEVLGAPEFIAQALDKLIDNAVSFSPPGRPITLRLELAGNECLVHVANEGPPLPEGLDGRLFDSMVSVRSARTGARDTGSDLATETPHLGLGLYIVRLVAELHGGRVHARSLSNPSGAELTLVLPRA